MSYFREGDKVELQAIVTAVGDTDANLFLPGGLQIVLPNTPLQGLEIIAPKFKVGDSVVWDDRKAEVRGVYGQLVWLSPHRLATEPGCIVKISEVQRIHEQPEMAAPEQPPVNIGSINEIRGA